MGAAFSSPLQPGAARRALAHVPPTARRNGLEADAYVPLLDLTPALTDGLLLALRRAGIAAYAAPTPRRRPGARVTTDRIWVEVWGRARAEDVVRAELPRTRR
jgi:hypothetical protein